MTALGPIVIVETIVTTVAEDGTSTARPWASSGARTRSCSNRSSRRRPTATFVATGAAVVNLTDDVRVFARAAIANPAVPDGAGRGGPRRRARRLLLVAGGGACARSTARRRVRESTRRWCTAGRAASSSASIGRATPCSKRRSTRRGCTCCRATFIDSELARLQVIVDKTAGARGTRGDGAAHRARPLRARRSRDTRHEPRAQAGRRCSSRRRRACTSACSTCAARSGAGSAASARRRRHRRCSSRLPTADALEVER